MVSLECMEYLFVIGLTYVFTHIEHFVDTVRNYVKLFFNELILVAAKHTKEGDNIH